MKSEYRKRDENGRIPLSFNEYEAMKTIFSAFNAVALYHGRLERRCKEYSGGWRDMRLLVKLSEKVMEGLLMTVPLKKLVQIRKELENSYCVLRTKGASGVDSDGFMYVREQTINELCQAATEYCFACEKTHKQAKSGCRLYANIQSICNFEFEDCDECPFSHGLDMQNN